MATSIHKTKTDEQQNLPFVSNHAMLARLEGSFTLQELQNALDSIRSRHTLLIPDFPSSHFLLEERTNCIETDWIDIAGKELLRAFPQNGPFARFILLRMGNSADLLAVFHHGICDGMSGVYVLRDTLQVLGQPDQVLQPIPAPPHIFGLIPAAVRANRRLRLQAIGFVFMLRFKLILSRLFPARVKKRLVLTSRSGSLPAKQSISILTERLTFEQTNSLIQRCKAERTTVHAAICTAFIRASFNQPGTESDRFRSISSPVSLRERLAIQETSGLFLANLITKVKCFPGRDFWEMAREFSTKLNQARNDSQLFRYPMLLETVFSRIPAKDIPVILPLLFNRPIRYDFSVTNLGRLDLTTRSGSLQVQSFLNLVNSSEYERTVCVNTFDGRLTYSLVFRASKMNLQQGRELMQMVKAELAKTTGASG